MPKIKKPNGKVVNIRKKPEDIPVEIKTKSKIEIIIDRKTKNPLREIKKALC